jgi:hypothetical protein
MTPQPQVTHDPVDRPRHYTFGGIEVIDAIEAWGCDFVEGNIIKYVARWKHKDGVTDLRKAAWYLNRLIDREIERRTAEQEPVTDTPREIET